MKRTILGRWFEGTLKAFVATAAVALAGAAWAADTWYDGSKYTWTYVINGDEAMIGDGTDVAINPLPDDDVTIPATLGGKPVTWIAQNAFKNCDALTGVTIPASVTDVDRWAFDGCSALSKVTVAEGNANYKSVNGMLLTKDGKTLVQGVSGDVVIPAGVETIADSAFYECSNVTSVDIPSSVTVIDQYAFDGCIALAEVTIPEGVTVIGDYSFNDCSGLKSVTLSAKGVERFRDVFDSYSALTVVIAADVTDIPDYAFYGCSGVESVVIPSTVVNIGEGAFQECDWLTSVTIPSSVVSIGDYVFNNCISLGAAIVPSAFDGSLDASVFDGCLVDPSEIDYFDVCVEVVDGIAWTYTVSGGEVTVGGGVEGLAIPKGTAGEIVIPSAFGGNPVTAIEEYAFYDCAALTGVTIPVGVKTIGEGAFSGCIALANVTISEGVESIGMSAFGSCEALMTIAIPASVTYIHPWAFDECTGITVFSVAEGNMVYKSVNGMLLTKDGTILVKGVNVDVVDIPAGVTTIGDSAFYSCDNLWKVTIPAGVTTIEDYAFDACNGLVEVTISDGVTTIGSHAFAACNGLNEVVIPSSVTTIEDYAFRACTYLAKAVVPISYTGSPSVIFEGCPCYPSDIESRDIHVAYVDDVVWFYVLDGDDNAVLGGGMDGLAVYAYTSGDLAIPATLGGHPVTTIGKGAFYGCTLLSEVTIPDGVTSIGATAFMDCTSLWGVMIPSTVTDIGASAFFNAGLLEVTVPYGVTQIALSAFSNCPYLTHAVLPLAFVDADLDMIFGTSPCNPYNIEFWNVPIIDGITWTYVVVDGEAVLGDGACGLAIPYDTAGDISIPASLGGYPVTVIGESAFNGCTDLTGVTIPDSVTRIEDNAFESCYSLTTVTIGSGVKSIGEYAFDYCALVSVEIPDSVETIGYGAFCECKCTSVTFGNGLKTIGERAFVDCDKLVSVEIPDNVESVENYAFAYCDSLATVKIGNGVTNVGNGAFSECGVLANLSIGTGVTGIGEDAFYGCSSLASLVVPGSVKSIGEYAFYECSGLTSITIGDGVESIGDYAFRSCTGAIPSIVIPDSVTSVGELAFCDCGVASVTIGNGLTSISPSMFAGCAGLESVAFGNAVTEIGYEAFFGCTSLASVVFPSSLTRIDSGAFIYCESLTDLTLPPNLESIGEGAFEGCTGITKLDIGDSVMDIGGNSFFGCTGLKKLRIGSGLANIPDSAFTDCIALEEVTIPENVMIVGMSAFEGCTALKRVTFPDGLMMIDEAAFKGCSALEEVVLFWQLLDLRDFAFKGCSNLKTAIIPADFATADISSVFEDTKRVEFRNVQKQTVDEVEWIYTIVDGEALVGGGVAGRAVSTDTEGALVIPVSVGYPAYQVTGIADGAFFNCVGITSVTIPEDVTSVGRDAFRNCTSLTEILLPEGVTTVGDNAFEGCSGLTVRAHYSLQGKFTVPDNCTIKYYRDGGGSGGGDAPPAPCYEALEMSDITEPYSAPSTVLLHGAVYDGCDVVGIVELKLGKEKKMTSKISGSVTLLDGKKHGIKAVTVKLDGVSPAVGYLQVKGLGIMHVAIGDNRFAGTLPYRGVDLHVQPAPVYEAWNSRTAIASVYMDDVSEFPGIVLTGLLPYYETASVDNGKWKFPKAASVKWAKPKNGAELSELYDPQSNKDLLVDMSKGKTNLSGMKLSYAPKKGTFKGGFKVCALQGDGGGMKLKKYAVKISGVVVDGVGYGVATSKNPAMSWPITVTK